MEGVVHYAIQFAEQEKHTHHVIPHWVNCGLKTWLPRESVVCGVAQSCPTLCDPVDYSPTGSSVHGVAKNRTQLSNWTTTAILQDLLMASSLSFKSHCRYSWLRMTSRTHWWKQTFLTSTSGSQYFISSFPPLVLSKTFLVLLFKYLLPVILHALPPIHTI